MFFYLSMRTNDKRFSLQETSEIGQRTTRLTVDGDNKVCYYLNVDFIMAMVDQAELHNQRITMYRRKLLNHTL